MFQKIRSCDEDCERDKINNYLSVNLLYSGYYIISNQTCKFSPMYRMHDTEAQGRSAAGVFLSRSVLAGERLVTCRSHKHNQPS